MNSTSVCVHIRDIIQSKEQKQLCETERWIIGVTWGYIHPMFSNNTMLQCLYIKHNRSTLILAQIVENMWWIAFTSCPLLPIYLLTLMSKGQLRCYTYTSNKHFSVWLLPWSSMSRFFIIHCTISEPKIEKSIYIWLTYISNMLTLCWSTFCRRCKWKGKQWNS